MRNDCNGSEADLNPGPKKVCLPPKTDISYKLQIVYDARMLRLIFFLFLISAHAHAAADVTGPARIFDGDTICEEWCLGWEL